MNVTTENFTAVYDQFHADLSQCTFYAVDCEMSGIFCDIPSTHTLHTCSNIIHQYNTLCQQSTAYSDTPEIRYGKLKQIASTYCIIQFGICLFTQIEHTQHYVVRPYNFYINRQQGHSITLQPSSIQFLHSCGLDFNEWLKNGINYCNRAQEHTLQRNIDEYDTNVQLNAEYQKTRDRVIPTDPADIELVNTALNGLTEWYNTDSNIRTELYLFEPMNGYHRLLVRQAIEQQYNNILTVELIKTDRRSTPTRKEFPRLSVCFMTAEQKLQKHMEQNQQYIDDMNTKLGFRRIFNLLTESHKPIITHNGALDIAFMMSAFDELPMYLHEFQQHYHTLFPVHYDTKTIVNQLIEIEQSNNVKHAELNVIDLVDVTDVDTDIIQKQRFTDSSLGSIYTVLSNESSNHTFECAAGFDRYKSDTEQSYAHEAAYDAYMTGVIFAVLSNELNLALKYTVPVTDIQLLAQPTEQYTRANIPLQNMIPFGGSMYMLSLDPIQTHPCITAGTKYYLSNMTADIRNDNVLIALFNDADVREYVQIRNITSTDAICIVSHRTLKPNVKNKLNITVQPYEQYRQKFIALQQAVHSVYEQVRTEREVKRDNRKRKYETIEVETDAKKSKYSCVIC